MATDTETQPILTDINLKCAVDSAIDRLNEAIENAANAGINIHLNIIDTLTVSDIVTMRPFITARYSNTRQI